MLYGADLGKSADCSSRERYLALVPKCAILSSDRSKGIANGLEYDVVGCSADLVVVCEVSTDGGGEMYRIGEPSYSTRVAPEASAEMSQCHIIQVAVV